MVQPIGLIGAMASEVELLTARLENPQTVSCGDLIFHQGRFGKQETVIVQCGIGKVCAAMCAQAMIDRFGVSAIVNTGVAGGLAASLAVGDLVVATDAIQHDFDLTAFGYARGYMPSAGGTTASPTRYPADEQLAERFCRAAAKVMTTGKTIRGTIVSGDIFVDDTALKRTLIQQFDAAAAEMEGAAIAQVAAANHIPFAIVRAISDLAEGGATISFDTFEKQAAALSCRILLTMLEEPYERKDAPC